MISADDQGIVLDLKVPDFEVEEHLHGVVLYHQVTIPDYGLTEEIGKPQVPVRGTLIGLPATGGMTLEILNVSSQIFKGYYVYPVPRSIVDPKSGLIQQEFAIDPEAYATDSFFPEAIVKEGFSGYMRDQRVVQLLFYPIQFNPISNEMKVYQTIRVKVSFEGTFPSGTAKPFAGISKSRLSVLNPYERLLEDTLLNYSSLPRSR
jgi:gingipain R